MERSNIEKIAQSAEDRLLLAKLWDKMNAGMRKNIPAATCFLSPRELEMAKYLFGEQESLYAFGGYEDAERKMLIFLPDYLDEASLYGEDSPCVCLRATFFQGDSPSHRDFLGALMGCGRRPGDGGRHLRGQGQLRLFRHGGDCPLSAADLHRRRPDQGPSFEPEFPFAERDHRPGAGDQGDPGHAWPPCGWTASYPPAFASGGASPPDYVDRRESRH